MTNHGLIYAAIILSIGLYWGLSEIATANAKAACLESGREWRTVAWNGGNCK